jgi:hypothetical protein
VFPRENHDSTNRNSLTFGERNADFCRELHATLSEIGGSLAFCSLLDYRARFSDCLTRSQLQLAWINSCAEWDSTNWKP